DRLASQILQERADGGELARRGRARVFLPETVGEEPAERLAIELRRREIGLRPIRLRRDEADELREIALVGAYRVRRRVAIEREKLQKRLEVVDHAVVGRPSRRRLPMFPAGHDLRVVPSTSRDP